MVLGFVARPSNTSGRDLDEIIFESLGPEHFRQTLVVCDKFAKEKSGLPLQKAFTLKVAAIQEWLVSTRYTQIQWTADENMIMNGLTKYRQGVPRMRFRTN